MNEYAKLAQQTGDQVLETVKRAYGIGVDAVSAASERSAEILPQLPEMPYAERIPTPRELTKVYFDFVSELTKAQRDYVLGLLDAIEPVTRKVMPSFAKATKPTTARKAA